MINLLSARSALLCPKPRVLCSCRAQSQLRVTIPAWGHRWHLGKGVLSPLGPAEGTGRKLWDKPEQQQEFLLGGVFTIVGFAEGAGGESTYPKKILENPFGPCRASTSLSHRAVPWSPQPRASRVSPRRVSPAQLSSARWEVGQCHLVLRGDPEPHNPRMAWNGP